MTLILIAAVARNRAIGLDNHLLYWLPNDLRRFKRLTMGHAIIMGRKTFESLPKGALPHRRNIVLSRTVHALPGCECYSTLSEALRQCADEDEVYVIGGESVYRQAIPYADYLRLTEVDDTPEKADAYFPPYDDWREIGRIYFDKDEHHAHSYAFVDYVRK